MHQIVCFLAGCAFGAALIVIITLIMLLFRFIRIDRNKISLKDRARSFTNPFWLIVYAAMEELFARGFLIGWLEHRVGLIVAFVISAVTFTVLHIPNGKVTVLSILNLLLSAIIFGIIYLKFGLLAAIGTHYAWNLMQWTVLGFPFYSETVGRLIQMRPVREEWKSGGQFGPEYSAVTTVIFTFAIGALAVA